VGGKVGGADHEGSREQTARKEIGRKAFVFGTAEAVPGRKVKAWDFGACEILRLRWFAAQGNWSRSLPPSR